MRGGTSGGGQILSYTHRYPDIQQAVTFCVSHGLTSRGSPLSGAVGGVAAAASSGVNPCAPMLKSIESGPNLEAIWLSVRRLQASASITGIRTKPRPPGVRAYRSLDGRVAREAERGKPKAPHAGGRQRGRRGEERKARGTVSSLARELQFVKPNCPASAPTMSR